MNRLYHSNLSTELLLELRTLIKNQIFKRYEKELTYEVQLLLETLIDLSTIPAWSEKYTESNIEALTKTPNIKGVYMSEILHDINIAKLYCNGRAINIAYELCQEIFHKSVNWK
jgi:hypothetical protein